MDNLKKALEELARGEKSELNAYFHEIQTKVSLENTSAVCHFHCLTLDGIGRPRVDGLIDFLINTMVDYSIPRNKIQEAYKDFIATGSSVKINQLARQAKGVFTRIDNSGEAGELILFTLAERFLKLPQLMCKMNLKTSSEMHFHGADGVHAGVDIFTNRLCLYWGESKLHAKPSDAVRECLKSIGPILTGTGAIGGAESRDLQLLQNYLTLNDPELEEALKRFLNPDCEDFNKLQYRGICLVGFDSNEYPADPNSKTIEQVKAAIEANLIKWQERISSRLIEEKLTAFNIHVFFLPFPSVEAFRLTFKAALEK